MDEPVDISDSVKKVLDKIRPYLAIDGGGVEFVRFEEETQVCEVRMTGNCATCPLWLMTLRAGIERFLINEISVIRRVEAVR
jgi:Fe-S cluster biogenesis protein NfuA